MNRFLFSVFSLVILSGVSPSVAVESGTLVPLYVYPTEGAASWQRLFDAYRAHPIETWAIVNVNSGPGTALDLNYVSAIRELQSVGIKTLGYVYTLYGNRDEATVRSEIDRWKTFYNTTGIFFDEMAYADEDAKVQFYQRQNDYAKGKGFTFTVGNPGTRTLPKYFATLDNIVVFETNTGFPSKELICSQDTNGKGRSSVSILPYNIPDLNSVSSSVTAVKDCAGLIYVTDDNGDNPWDTLPHYLTQLFELLRG